MRGRYLIRSARSAVAVGAVDAILRFLPKRSGDLQRPVRRILVANWAHLGDVLLTLPAIVAIRNTYPDAYVGMIVGSWAEIAIRELQLIDQVHVIDHWFLNRNGVGRVARYRRTCSRALPAIRAARYQVGIDFYPFFAPAHPLFYRCGIPCRVGFDSGGFGPLLTHPVRWLDKDRSISDYARDLVKVVLPDIRDWKWRYPLRNGRPAAVEAAARPYIVVHPGAGSRVKDWGEGNWRDLIVRLKQQGHRIVLTGAGAYEEALAERITAGDDSTVNLVGKTDWEGFVSTVAGADALICPDSSAAHVGGLFEIPTVAIFTGTNNPAQWGPCNPYARLLVKQLACAPCYRPGCSAMACIRGVTVDEVLNALRECQRERNGLCADEAVRDEG
jgi:ADP-heptose:LPS heptosyltransferase